MRNGDVIDLTEREDGTFSQLETKERITAVLNTLRSNQTVLLDADLALATTTMFASVGAPFLGAVFGFGISVLHPTLSSAENDQRISTANVNKSPTALKEDRHFVNILVDAWKTGKTQTNLTETYVPENI